MGVFLYVLFFLRLSSPFLDEGSKLHLFQNEPQAAEAVRPESGNEWPGEAVGCSEVVGVFFLREIPQEVHKIEGSLLTEERL